MKLAVSLVLLTLVVVVKAGKVCKLNTDCGLDESCLLVSDHPVVEKRDGAAKTGTCGKYLTEGSSCDGVDVVNGYSCGCAEGLDCRAFSEDETLGRRRRRDWVEGWESKCAKPE